MDRLISGVGRSRKGNKHKKNGLINFEAEDAIGIEREILKLSTEVEQVKAICVENESSNSTDPDPEPDPDPDLSLSDFDSLGSERSSVIEQTSDISPTSGRAIWSTPSSPRISGIVKQRLEDLKKFSESSQSIRSNGSTSKSQSTPSSPQYQVKTFNFNCDKFSNLPPPDDKLRRYYCGLARNEKFTNAVMERGYVKALVDRINVKKSLTSENGNDGDTVTNGETEKPKEMNEKMVQNNSKQDSNEIEKTSDLEGPPHKVKHGRKTPEGSPNLRSKRGNKTIKKSPRNAIISNNSNNSDNLGPMSPAELSELFDNSWSDSDHSFDDYSDESDIEDQISNGGQVRQTLFDISVFAEA